MASEELLQGSLPHLVGGRGEFDLVVADLQTDCAGPLPVQPVLYEADEHREQCAAAAEADQQRAQFDGIPARVPEGAGARETRLMLVRSICCNSASRYWSCSSVYSGSPPCVEHQLDRYPLYRHDASPFKRARQQI